MAEGAPRSSFSFPAVGELRDRAERVGQGMRRGRPRDRFLAERRGTLFRYLVPGFALAALVSGTVAIVDMTVASFLPNKAATLAEVAASLVLGLSVALAVVFRRNLVAIRILHATGASLSQLAWGVAAHYTGGAASPYLLALPLSHVLFAGVMPASPWVAVASGLSCWGALLIASPASPLPIHFVVLASVISSVVLAMMRHKRRLQTFLKMERLSGAVARMRRMQEQLVVIEKLEALRVLVGGMAHELNNALAVSLASNQQVTRDLAQEKIELARSAVLRSDGGLMRIKKTVDRLRRFAMAAEGKLEPADVGAMLDFALESAIGRARSGVIIERSYDPQVGAIECHVSALAEALYQVARNAVEAMPGGGTIQASVRKDGERVVLSVADQGQGIPPEQIPRIFDPFYRAEGKGVSKSGLGLSAVYGVISALGGHIDIKSQVGKGTEIAIVMPARKASIRPPAP